MSTLNNKLDYLDETKQLIKQAIIDKGQEVSDEDTFRSYVDKISDIETGNDTKDATATSNDILYPETAYISNGKVTGNIMPTYSSNTTLSQINTIIRSLSYSLLDINYDAKIAIISDEDYKFNFCNIVNNEIDYENSTYITLNNFEEGMDGTYTFSKCCTNFDKNTNNLYLYLLFTFQNTFKVFCYIYNIKTKNSKYIDTYELTIDDANNSLVLNMIIRPNYPNQVIVFCGYTSTVALGSYLTTIFLQFNTVALELQKIEDTISTSGNQYAALVESCYFISNGEYLCINVRTGTLFGTTQNGVIYHCVNNFLESIVDSTQYVTLFENGNYMAYNQSTRNYCLFNVNGDVLYSYSGNLGEISTEQLIYTNKCILGNYLFGFAYPNDFINPGEPFKLYCCKLNEDYTITKEQEIDVGSRVLFNCYNVILYDNKNTRNFDGYLGETEKEIISLNRNNINYYSTKDADAAVNDVVSGKIFYNKDGKQVGVGEFGNFVDIDLSYINASITVTGDIKNLIGNTTGFMMKNVDVDKCKIYDIIIVPINMFETGSNIPNLKCNCVCKIESITADLSSSYSYIDGLILAADINTEDGTATSEDIVEGKIAYVNNQRIKGTARLGIDTSDATAVATDILAPKTAYVNGQKITGNITTTYDTSLPEEISRQITYNTEINDINLNYNIAVYCSSTSLIKIYKIINNVIEDASYISVTPTEWSTSITFYTGTAKLAQEKFTDNEIDYLRVFVAAKNSSNTVGIASFLININTFTVTDFMFSTVSSGIAWNNRGTSSHTPQLTAVPKTNSNCLIAYYNIGGADTWTHFQVKQFTRTSVSSSSVWWLGDNNSSTARGFNGTTVQFSDDGNLLVICTSMSRYGRETRGNFVATSASGFKSYSVLYQSKAWANDTANLYKLVDNTKVSNLNKIYNINNLNSSVGTLPYNATWQTQGIQIGKYLYYLETATSTTLKVYKINDTSLTLENTLNISAGKWFFHYGKEILYTNTENNIVGYKLGDSGLLVKMNRLGTNFFNLFEASSTTSDDILKGSIVYLNSGKTVGTMPNNGELNYEVSTIKQTIPSGYTSGGIIAASPVLQEDYDNCLNIANQILGDTNQTEYIYTENVITFNYIPNNKSRIEICAAIYGNGWNNYFGIDSTQFLLQRWSEVNEWRLFIADKQQGGNLLGIAEYEQQIVEISREGLFINKKLIQSISSTDYSNISTNLQLHLNGNSSTKFKFWYMKIWEDDILVRNYQIINQYDNKFIYDNITDMYIDYVRAEED